MTLYSKKSCPKSTNKTSDEIEVTGPVLDCIFYEILIDNLLIRLVRVQTSSSEGPLDREPNGSQRDHRERSSNHKRQGGVSSSL